MTALTTHLKQAAVVQPIAQIVRILAASNLAPQLHARGLAELCRQAAVLHAADGITVVEVLHAVEALARHDGELTCGVARITTMCCLARGGV